MIPRNGNADSQKNDKKKRPNAEEMGRTKKEKLFLAFVFNAPGIKLIHNVKELKDVGERNIQLEQTKEI